MSSYYLSHEVAVDQDQALVRYDPIYTFTTPPTRYDHIATLPTPCTLCCVHIYVVRFHMLNSPALPAACVHVTRPRSTPHYQPDITVEGLLGMLLPLSHALATPPPRAMLTGFGYAVEADCSPEQYVAIRQYCDQEGIFLRILPQRHMYRDDRDDHLRLQAFLPDRSYQYTLTPNSANANFWRNIHIRFAPRIP